MTVIESRIETVPSKRAPIGHVFILSSEDFAGRLIIDRFCLDEAKERLKWYLMTDQGRDALCVPRGQMIVATYHGVKTMDGELS